MPRTSVTACLLAGSVASPLCPQRSHRLGSGPSCGTADVASDGMFTYSRTASVDRWEDDPSSFGSDRFTIVVTDGDHEVGEIVITPVLSTSATEPITAVGVVTTEGTVVTYEHDAAASARRRPLTESSPPRGPRVTGAHHRLAVVRFGTETCDKTFQVFVSDGVRGTTSYLLGVPDGPLDR
ncbi:hypothetical protein [Rhodococcus sp. SORGH_AS_0303]|uniref:hypothetical protein n=1 Tax=Rhodococcus sp. SORGH_AS_0303 TaxID=3041753 RepID=UPI00277E8C48|nr:hypothetical protein [Rhodococcus sp. SORGH_AS_0303]MDQ1199662.1 hypothetical protein [Rhodococcus sp. SORGH_AS_0303]